MTPSNVCRIYMLMTGASSDGILLNSELNEELVKVTEWLASNKLTLNTENTQYRANT